MNFLDAVKQCWRKYGDFGGRATRAEFWWWQLFGWTGGLIFGAVDSFITSLVTSFSPAEFAFSPFGALFGLAILLPGLAVQARRLHDIGKTGWWILAWFAIYMLGLVPLIVGGVITLVSIFSSPWGGGGKATINFRTFVPLIAGGLVMLAIFLTVTVWWIVWMARQGQSGTNRFGPDPRAWDAPQPAPPAIE